MRILPMLAAMLCGAFGLSAQNFDMIGVTFAGQVLRIDSATGATSVLATGQIGKNCLAIGPDDRIWTTVRTVLPPFRFHLAVIDPFTGSETLPFGTTNVGDLRGMTFDFAGTMLAIRDASPSDELVQVDLNTGAVTLLGATGFTGLQDLDDTLLSLRAWDITAGLIQVDAQTGAATDPFPGQSGPAALQWLTTEQATGRCVVGRDTLQDVNLFQGTVGPATAIQGAPDLRGAVFTTGRVATFGTACGGLARINGHFQAGSSSQVNIVSGIYTPSALGVQILGFSATSHLGQPLPQNLDPLAGTVGCQLNVSIDITQIGFVSTTGRLVFPINLPPSFPWFVVNFQHAVFEAVPGGMTWTSGLRLRTRL